MSLGILVVAGSLVFLCGLNVFLCSLSQVTCSSLAAEVPVQSRDQNPTTTTTVKAQEAQILASVMKSVSVIDHLLKTIYYPLLSLYVSNLLNQFVSMIFQISAGHSVSTVVGTVLVMSSLRFNPFRQIVSLSQAFSNTSIMV